LSAAGVRAALSSSSSSSDTSSSSSSDAADDGSSSSPSSSQGASSAIEPGDDTTSVTPLAPPATVAVDDDNSGEGGPSSSSPPASAASPAPIDETYQLVGGTVTVRYENRAAHVLWASPSPGFEVENNGGDDATVDVRFRSSDHESRLRAWWDNGPQHSVEEKND
jgi:hypothetical protein